MKSKILIFLLIAMVFSTTAFAQKSYWEKEQTNRSTNSFTNLKDESYHINALNFQSFKAELSKAIPREIANRSSDVIIFFPNEKGDLEKFRVQEVSIFSDELAKKYPNIKAYIGYGIDTPGARVRFSVSPQGLQSMTSYPNKSRVFTVPTARGKNTQYVTYQNESRKEVQKRFSCLTKHDELTLPDGTKQNRDANDQILRTFRIAISTTGEYTDFWDDGNTANGDAQQDALAQVVSTLNRNNEVFEVDMAITFQLVTGTELIYPNANSDPYTNNLNGQLQVTLNNEVGSANYDIGHLFAYGSNNGNAGCIGCVCQSNKGSAFSSHSFLDNDGGPYMSDFFDIDYVPHEIGHQMGANHTWAFASEGTGVNVEPGSGTTIMGYAGIRQENDVQDHSDPYFNYHSIRQILDNVASAPNNCWTSTTIVNNPPVANAGNDYTIPQGTAFVLRGAATDADGSDVLTYSWEQINSGVTTFSNFGPNKVNGPLWRSRPPNTDPNRYMPVLSRIVSGNLTETNPVETPANISWETVSTVSRTLTFALTVRDRSESNGTGQFPQTSYDDMTITVDGSSGPFAVTSQTTSEVWERDTSVTVTWDVAGTDGGSVNTSTVRIVLSADGGLTFPTELVASVPNNGSATFMLPNNAPLTNSARIMVEANDNIFLAVNSANFNIIENTAGVSDDELEGFQLYPNPNNGDFKLKFNSTNETVQLRVFDLAGRTVHAKDYTNVLGFFDEDVRLGNMASGIYLLRVINGSRLTTQKIIIE